MPAVEDWRVRLVPSAGCELWASPLVDVKDGAAEFLLENFARRRALMSPAVPMGLT